MKLVLFLLVALLITFPYLSSAHNPAKPGFTVTGNILNSDAKGGYIRYYTDSLNWKNVEVFIKNGKFHYKIDIVRSPYIASLTIGNIRFSIAIAPGYEVQLSGDFSSDSAFRATVNFTGQGSLASNLLQTLDYRVMLNPCFDKYTNDIDLANCFANQWESTKKIYTRKMKAVVNSGDAYLPVFSKAIWYELNFFQLESVSLFLKTRCTKLGYEKTMAILKHSVDQDILNNISDEKYLISPNYIWMIGQGNQYIFLKTKLAHINDSTELQLADYLVQIEQNFTGRPRSYYLHFFLTLVTGAQGSYENLLIRKQPILNYAEKIENITWKKELLEFTAAHEKRLLQNKIGQPAPLFALKDATGNIYRLEDFKGKIVLLDFWASWCGPCRQQTAYLKTLYERYSKTGKVAFISIAVRDRDAAWRKAMHEDNIPWLNVWGVGSTEADYSTNAIPKFVLIDPAGNILNFEADSPGDSNQLSELIDTALTSLKN